MDTDLAVFELKPAKGVIYGGKSTEITAIFNPFMVGEYQGEVPVFLNQDTTHPYVNLILKGKAKNPRI